MAGLYYCETVVKVILLFNLDFLFYIFLTLFKQLFLTVLLNKCQQVFKVTYSTY